MEDINMKGIPEYENLKKVIDIVEKSLISNKQQGKRLEIFTQKQMLQKLPLTLTKWNQTNHICFLLRKRSY